MRLLLDRPNLYERCAPDHDYCRKILDESLRLFTPSDDPAFSDPNTYAAPPLVAAAVWPAPPKG